MEMIKTGSDYAIVTPVFFVATPNAGKNADLPTDQTRKENKTMRKWTIAEIKALNTANELNFFSRGAMRFFNTRIVSTAYNGEGGTFFITSEHNRPTDAPKFTIRKFHPETGEIKTFGEFRGFRYIEDARDAARAAAKGEAN